MLPSPTPEDVVARLRAAGCVFAEEEAALLLQAAGGADLAALVDQRVAGLPLEHLLGWAEFDGLRIAVDPGVFVPRARTAFLVEQAAALAATPPAAAPVVVDLCCGTGALGVALLTRLHRAGRRSAVLHAADVDPAAVACARRNTATVGGLAWCGDLFEALPVDLRGRVDLLLVNAPYVPTAAITTMPPEARLHEPRVALDGGEDGVDVHRRVAAQAAAWLAPGGHLLVETSDDQAELTAAAVTAGGLDAAVTGDDDRDATVVIGAVRTR